MTKNDWHNNLQLPREVDCQELSEELEFITVGRCIADLKPFIILNGKESKYLIMAGFPKKITPDDMGLKWIDEIHFSETIELDDEGKNYNYKNFNVVVNNIAINYHKYNDGRKKNNNLIKKWNLNAYIDLALFTEDTRELISFSWKGFVEKNNFSIKVFRYQ